MQEQNTPPKKSIKERFEEYAPLTVAFAAGAITSAAAIRYRNGIGLNELIWCVPVEILRERVKDGSPYLLETPRGVMYCAKHVRNTGMPVN